MIGFVTWHTCDSSMIQCMIIIIISIHWFSTACYTLSVIFLSWMDLYFHYQVISMVVILILLGRQYKPFVLFNTFLYEYRIAGIYREVFNFVIWDDLQKLKLAHIFGSIHFSYIIRYSKIANISSESKIV